MSEEERVPVELGFLALVAHLSLREGPVNLRLGDRRVRVHPSQDVESPRPKRRRVRGPNLIIPPGQRGPVGQIYVRTKRDIGVYVDELEAEYPHMFVPEAPSFTQRCQSVWEELEALAYHVVHVMR